MEIKLNYKRHIPDLTDVHKKNIATVDLVLICGDKTQSIEIRIQCQLKTNEEIERGRESIHFEKGTKNVVIPLRLWAFDQHTEMPDRRDMVSLLNTTVAEAMVDEIADSIETIYIKTKESGELTCHPVLKFNARPALLELESLLTHCRIESNEEEQ